MILAADEQLLFIVILFLSVLLLVAQKISELPLPGSFSLLTLLVKSSLKCQLKFLLRVPGDSGVHSLAESSRQVLLMREEVLDVIVLFEAAEAHMGLVDFFAVLETGEED